MNEVLVGKEFFRGNYEWFDTSNFWLNAGTTGSLLVRLVIEIEGTMIINKLHCTLFLIITKGLHQKAIMKVDALMLLYLNLCTSSLLSLIRRVIVHHYSLSKSAHPDRQSSKVFDV